jgi:hypothetical protein
MTIAEHLERYGEKANIHDEAAKWTISLVML